MATLILWQWASSTDMVPPQLLSAPAATWQSFLALLGSGELAGNLLCSFRRVLLAFVVGASLGLLAGWAMGLSRRLERWIYPTIAMVAQVPALGFIPLAMMVLGIGESLKIVIVAKAVFIPVLINSMRAVSTVSDRYWELASVCQLSRWTTIRRVLVPACLHPILTGLRLGLSQAWLALVTVELLASSEGIGYLLIQGRQLNQIDVVLVSAVVIGISGFALDTGLRGLQRLLFAQDCPLPVQGVARAHSTAKSSLSGFILPVLLVLLWSGLVALRTIDARFLPSPRVFLRTFQDELVSGDLLLDIGWSLRRMAMGLTWGAVLGIAVGIVTGRVKLLSRILLPPFHALRQIALVAWIPLFTLWLGQGESAKQTFVAVAVFIPMLIAAYDGSRAITTADLELSATLALPRLAKLRFLLLPTALPHLLSGLELGIVYAWLATIASEYFFKVAPGVGNTMVDGREHLRMDLVMCGIVVVGLIGFASNRLVVFLRHRVCAWATR